jgi:hypothetical protein
LLAPSAEKLRCSQAFSPAFFPKTCNSKAGVLGSSSADKSPVFIKMALPADWQHPYRQAIIAAVVILEGGLLYRKNGL